MIHKMDNEDADHDKTVIMIKCSTGPPHWARPIEAPYCAHPYWGSWEDVVFEHLMALNARGERLDPLFSGLLDRVKKDDEDEDDTTG